MVVVVAVLAMRLTAPETEQWRPQMWQPKELCNPDVDSYRSPWFAVTSAHFDCSLH